jgi:LPPG:FO 2-phospho-L-lactate transferase
MKIVVFAGGVGGAKFVDGLAKIHPAEDLTVVVNTGDDFNLYGLHICPDIDTICYTLAGLANPETGWGRSNETWSALEIAASLGGPDWFQIGDRDLGLHMERTRRIGMGQPLSTIVREFCNLLNIAQIILPMTDSNVPTLVETLEYGTLPFQDYFVRLHCAPTVTGFIFSNNDLAVPAPGVLEAIQSADLVIFAPSNPWVSIGPILAVPGISDSIRQKFVVAISPIVNGKSIRGPAAKMFTDMGMESSALAVANHYRGWIKGFVMDRQDAGDAKIIAQWGIIVLETNAIMSTVADRQRLASEVLLFSQKVIGGLLPA